MLWVTLSPNSDRQEGTVTKKVRVESIKHMSVFRTSLRTCTVILFTFSNMVVLFDFHLLWSKTFFFCNGFNIRGCDKDARIVAFMRSFGAEMRSALQSSLCGLSGHESSRALLQ